MNVVYYLASSLDGYIADNQDGVAWLDEIAIDHTNTGYEAFYEEVDGLIMGRKTYDFIFDYGEWPYNDKPTWVCSSKPIEALEGCNLQPDSDLTAAVASAKSLGVSKLWVVGGGELAGAMIAAELLTLISVSVMPVALGEGKKLFSSLPTPIYLHQESSINAAGFTQLEYKLSY